VTDGSARSNLDDVLYGALGGGLQFAGVVECRNRAVAGEAALVYGPSTFAPQRLRAEINNRRGPGRLGPGPLRH
jgi:hypothetical protein